MRKDKFVYFVKEADQPLESCSKLFALTPAVKVPEPDRVQVMKEEQFSGLQEALLSNSASTSEEVSEVGVSKVDMLRKLIKERVQERKVAFPALFVS